MGGLDSCDVFECSSIPVSVSVSFHYSWSFCRSIAGRSTARCCSAVPRSENSCTRSKRLRRCLCLRRCRSTRSLRNPLESQAPRQRRAVIDCVQFLILVYRNAWSRFRILFFQKRFSRHDTGDVSPVAATISLIKAIRSHPESLSTFQDPKRDAKAVLP